MLDTCVIVPVLVDPLQLVQFFTNHGQMVRRRLVLVVILVAKLKRMFLEFVLLG